MIQAPKRGRGRPALVHDNSLVQKFISEFPTAAAFLEEHPRMDDVLTGAARAQTAGHTATRPLSKGSLFGLLRLLPAISTVAVGDALQRHGYCATTIKRYAQAARTASVFIARELDRDDALALS